MELRGSCHCRAVAFTVTSAGPLPYQRCYCSICRKAGGAGGFAINILADNGSMKVIGREHVREYRARRNGELSKHRRYFCARCGSHMWAWHEDWSDLVHPLASVIDTPLPRPENFVDIMLDSAAPWVALYEGENIERFPEYPAESIEAWHKRLGVWDG